MERKLTAILAADVVGYSALMERDEAGTFDRLRAHRKELFESEIARHHGRVFKLMGDGLLAEFGSVVDAVECAVSLQRGMSERNAAVPEDQRIDIRIGINLGEVIIEGDDRYGEGVNVAARLEQLAEPGGIWVSGKVAKEVEKKLAFGFEPMGEQKVKNLAEPVPAFRVRLDGLPGAPRLRSSARPRWAVIAAAIALFALMAGAVGSWYTDLWQPAPSTSGSKMPAIAVLPFENMSGDSALGYMGDGIADDIITALSRFPDLSVIARNSSFAYKGTLTDVRKIGKELGVGYVLEGSVRKSEDEIRIVAQLIDASDGKHVWADRFDESSNDPLALQDDVTTRIVATLAGESGQIRKADYQRAWGKDSANLEEYDYYLRGHDYFMQDTKESYARAGEIWREGLAKFPNSTLLKVKLGMYHFFNAFNFFSDDMEFDYRRGAELGREVLASKPLTPQVARLAHMLMTWVHVQERSFEQAIGEAERTRALAPRDASSNGFLATPLILSGRPDQGIEWAEEALAADPASRPWMNYRFGLAYSLKGENERSVAALENAPEWPDILLLRAIGLVRLGRVEEAQALYEKAHAANPAFTQATWRQGYFYSDPAIVEEQVADLAKLGLPER